MTTEAGKRAGMDSEADARWVHPLCKPLGVDRSGPFLLAPDGSLLSADDRAILVSRDEGRTWSEAAPACFGQHPREPASYYLLHAQDGALVMVYLDLARYTFSWDDATGEPKDDCSLGLWTVRSPDGGKTWAEPQQLLDGYNANFFGCIRLRNGNLVVSAEHLVTKPGRWVACSFVSADAGRSWRRSNLIDLGGHGHHDGAIEPTVAELSDGRLLMLIRTNLDRFWQAISEDGGRTWRTVQPSPIDASTSPGYLLRLRSGRLFLVWNRLAAEGQSCPRGQPGPASEVAASWHREELSAAFSDDDGKTWTRPLVIARQKDGQLSYPYSFEPRAGDLWIMAGFAFRKGWQDPVPLRLKVTEEELLAEARRRR